jgi:ligand-binding sensor domain-containing protein
VWLYNNHHFQKKNYPIARSVQNAISDENGGLWIATKVGLYHCSEKNTTLYQDTTQLISAYVEDVALRIRATMGSRFGWRQHQSE